MPPPYFSIFLENKKLEFTLKIEEKWWRHMVFAYAFLAKSAANVMIFEKSL